MLCQSVRWGGHCLSYMPSGADGGGSRGDPTPTPPAVWNWGHHSPSVALTRVTVLPVILTLADAELLLSLASWYQFAQSAMTFTVYVPSGSP